MTDDDDTTIELVPQPWPIGEPREVQILAWAIQLFASPEYGARLAIEQARLLMPYILHGTEPPPPAGTRKPRLIK